MFGGASFRTPTVFAEWCHLTSGNCRTYGVGVLGKGVVLILWSTGNWLASRQRRLLTVFVFCAVPGVVLLFSSKGLEKTDRLASFWLVHETSAWDVLLPLYWSPLLYITRPGGCGIVVVPVGVGDSSNVLVARWFQVRGDKWDRATSTSRCSFLIYSCEVETLRMAIQQ